MTKIQFQAEDHKMDGPAISVSTYDPRFRSFDSDDRLISAQEIGAAMRGEFGSGTFKVYCWEWKRDFLRQNKN